LRMTTLARTATIVNERPILSSDRILFKDYDSKCSVGEEIQTCRQQGYFISVMYF
jgi:hypothetical protein